MVEFLEVDECEDTDLACQICINRRGSFNCYCIDGFSLTNESSCKGDQSQQLYSVQSLSDQFKKFSVIPRYVLDTSIFTSK